jgi:hypothetical protein
MSDWAWPITVLVLAVAAQRSLREWLGAQKNIEVGLLRDNLTRELKQLRDDLEALRERMARVENRVEQVDLRTAEQPAEVRQFWGRR